MTLDDKDFVVADVLTRETGIWNKAALEKYLPSLIDEILLLHPSTTGAEDSYAWLLQSSGSYSAKSGYTSLQKDGTIQEINARIPASFNWFRSVWNTQTLPKVQLFLWKIIQNALPTGKNLQRRGLLSNTNCIRCGEQETTLHLVFHCDFAQQVWNLVPWSSPLLSLQVSNFAEELDRSRHRLNLPPTGTMSNLFPWIVWFIWTARNLLIFETRHTTPAEVLGKAIVAAKEWITAQVSTEKLTQLRTQATHQLTNPLDLHQTIICNTDAAWKPELKRAGLGWTFTNWNLEESDRGSQIKHHVPSALLAEGLAVKAALMHAISLGITHIWLRSDSQVLVKAINENRRSTELYGTLSDIASLASSSFTSCRFSFIPRSQNGLADSIAKACLCNSVHGP